VDSNKQSFSDDKCKLQRVITSGIVIALCLPAASSAEGNAFTNMNSADGRSLTFRLLADIRFLELLILNILTSSNVVDKRVILAIE
jgi:hypothetical protein